MIGAVEGDEAARGQSVLRRRSGSDPERVVVSECAVDGGVENAKHVGANFRQENRRASACEIV